MFLFLAVVLAIRPPFGTSPMEMAKMRALQNTMSTPLLPGSTLDPNLLSTAPSCDRDYSNCPAGFVMIGPIYGSNKFCGADRAVYFGPCGVDPVDFSRFSFAAKQRWAEFCNTFWPCIQCTRNFFGCPKRWRPAADGHCRGPNGDLEIFSILSDFAKDVWSQATGFYWPCKH